MSDPYSGAPKIRSPEASEQTAPTATPIAPLPISTPFTAPPLPRPIHPYSLLPQAPQLFPQTLGSATPSVFGISAATPGIMPVYYSVPYFDAYSAAGLPSWWDQTASLQAITFAQNLPSVPAAPALLPPSPAWQPPQVYPEKVAPRMGTKESGEKLVLLDQLACPPSRLTLDFRSATWQNRPSRIYLQFLDNNTPANEVDSLDGIPRFVVLEETGRPKRLPLPFTQPNTQDILIFNYSDTNPFFELQVWHRSGRFTTKDGFSHAEPSLILDAHSPFPAGAPITIKILRTGVSRTGPYFTIQCSKGLKVHDLFLVCVLRLDAHRLYASTPTPFPSSETRKNRARPSNSERHGIDSPLS